MAWRAIESGDYLAWGKILFPDMFPLPFCRAMHPYFMEIADEKFTVTEAPRGTAKTAINCSLIPLAKALAEPKKYDYYLNVQSTEEKALAVNRSIKTSLETNGLLRAMYGNLVGKRWTDGEFEISTGVVFKCLGAGQSIRGIQYENRRPRYVIVDDLYDRDDIYSFESTKKKTDWFWSDLYPAIAQYGNTAIHVQGTAINKYDLLEELKKKKNVISRTFKTIIDMNLKTVIWPEQKTYDDAMRQRDDMPLVAWEREFQNERRDDSTSIIKQAWLADWKFDPVDLRREIKEGMEIKRDEDGREIERRRMILDAVIIGNDPSIGKNLKSDLNGLCLTFKTHWTDADDIYEFWIIGLWNERLSLEGRANLIKTVVLGQMKPFGITACRIEAISGFDDYASVVASRVDVPVTRIDHVPDKMANLENKSSFFQRKRVHLNRDIDQGLQKEIQDQLLTNVPPHDDLRDAVFLTLDSSTGRGPQVW